MYPAHYAGGGFVDPLGFNSPPPDPKPAIPTPILDAFAASNASANTSAMNTSSPTAAAAPAPGAAAGAAPSSVTTTGKKILQDPAAQTPTSEAANALPGVLQQPDTAAVQAAGPAVQTAAAAAEGTNTTQSSAAAAAALNDLLPLDVSVEPFYVVPLKVVAGISSSFLTVGAMPTTPAARELTGTETLG